MGPTSAGRTGVSWGRAERGAEQLQPSPQPARARDPAGAAPGLRTPSGLGESGERRPFGSDPCPWPRAPSSPLPAAFAGKLASPRCCSSRARQTCPARTSPSSLPASGRSGGLGAGGRGGRTRDGRRPRAACSSPAAGLVAGPSVQPCSPLGSHLGSLLFWGRPGRGSLVLRDLALLGDLRLSLR